MSRLTRLTLNQFRNYDAARLEFESDCVIFTGANGAGKTNILEAISLFNPKYALKGAALEEMKNIHALPHELCAVVADVTDGAGIKSKLAMALKREGALLKRELRLDERLCPSQAVLLEHIALQWLTPQMDGLFLGAAAERRRFLDRMVAIFDHVHVGRLNHLDKLWRERSAILQQGGRADPLWLGHLEQKIAEQLMTTEDARLLLLQRLSLIFMRLEKLLAFFPKPLLTAISPLPLMGEPALEREERVREILKEDRAQDMLGGKNKSGLHRFDFEVMHAQQNMKAHLCSTGEQKALLISLVLGFAYLLKAEKGRPPILLLDEVVAHLDAARRMALYELIKALGTQVFLTGTEPLLFEAWGAEALFLKVEHGQVMPYAKPSVLAREAR
jgi:DNA replication and repair protein RecF